MLEKTNFFKVILIFVAVFATYSAQAQWTTVSGGINYNGNVGIAQSSPQTSLHIGSKAALGGGTNYATIRLSFTNTQLWPSSTTNWDIQGTGNLNFRRNGTTKFTVNNSGINVLGSQIVLGSGSQQTYLSNNTHALTGKSGSAIVFGGKPLGSGYQFFGSSSDNGGGAITTDNDGNMYFLTKAAGGSSILNVPNTIDRMHMKISNDGRVSIGEVGLPNSFQNTDGEEYTLYVRGGIYTQEVTVNLNNTIFPDYVFEEDYDLPTLQEIEAFVNENKHLPNTPSASELAENGMNLKELTVVQQESIEQLYLHIIALEKRIKELEAKK